MRYSIGDVSRVLGMTTSALHFYEKEGIINTPKEESGRRYYEEVDIMRLISAKKYRSMGVPVRDIAQQFSEDGMTGTQVIARIKARRDEAVRAAKEYAALAADIDHLIDHSEKALLTENEVDIRQTKDMIYLRSSSGGRIPRDKEEQRLTGRWLEAMPSVRISICKEETDERAVPALILPEARAKDFGLFADGRMTRRIPGGPALHAVVSCGEEQYEDPDVIFRPILAFAREHRFVQKGTMWGCMLFVDCSGGVRRHYFDTYMTFA